jgi:hypothetical protein
MKKILRSTLNFNLSRNLLNSFARLPVRSFCYEVRSSQPTKCSVNKDFDNHKEIKLQKIKIDDSVFQEEIERIIKSNKLVIARYEEEFTENYITKELSKYNLDSYSVIDMKANPIYKNLLEYYYGISSRVYIFINGKHMSISYFNALLEENNLEAFLKQENLIE